jgi:hypothetical protein
MKPMNGLRAIADMCASGKNQRNPGEGDLFFFHGAFTKKSDAVKRVQERPGTFVRTVYFRNGMRYAVLEGKRQENPHNLPVVRWRKPTEEIGQKGRSARSNHPTMRPIGPKKCELCGSKKNIVVDHKNGNNADIRRGNHRWLCNACNIREGYRHKRLGIGTRQERQPGQTAPEVGTIVVVKKTTTRPREKGAKPRKVTTLAAAKRNPGGSTLAGSARLFKKFIGRQPTKVTRIKTTHPAAQRAPKGKLPVAKMAMLSYLKVRNPRVKGGMIRFSGAERPKLLSHASGRQYYFQGGNQRLDGIPAKRMNPNEYISDAHLERAGLSHEGRYITLGEVSEIGYFERKAVEDFRPTEYFHKPGEENGKRPILVYDPQRKQMHLVGGDYRTLWNGINN